MPLKKVSTDVGIIRSGQEKRIPTFQPTPFQAEVFLRITPAGTTLITAPTGSGKTEAAFLPALNRYLSSQFNADAQPVSPGVRILFVCPLKALVDDLSERLERIISEHCPIEYPSPGVTKLTGDTPSGKRLLFRKHPKPILVTTPESLARLLAHPDRRFFLQTTQTVIVDEWHALAPTKRGADLSLSLARLSVLCTAPPKRIGLSATVANPHFLARQLAESPDEIQVLASRDHKNPNIEIHSIEPSKFWLDEVTKYLCSLSTCGRPSDNPILVFVQTRSMAERLAYQLSSALPNLQVVLHHGSLSESIRRCALTQILSGSPDIILSTASLELGVDIGAVRTVVLLDTPGEIIRMIQRIGRSGRGPRQTPKGILLIRHPDELLEAGLSAALGMENWLETMGTNFPHPPIDLLCQHLLGEAIAEPFSKIEAFQWLTRSPYFPSPQDIHLQNALDFLVGCGPKGSLGIPPRLKEANDKYQVISNRINRMVLQSIGTIQADPLIPVLCEMQKEAQELSTLWVSGKRNDKNCIGHVGEFYADTIKPGDRFLLAGKVWERSGGDFQHIVAKPHEGTPQHLRWPGNRPPKSAPLCTHLFSFRTLAKEKLLGGATVLAEWLRIEMPFKIADSLRIADWLDQQERKSEIPDISSVLVESINTNDGHSSDYDIHLPFPAGICSKLGQLLLFRIKKNYGTQLITGISTAATNLGLRILDSENTLVMISNNLSQTPVQLIQTFFCDENWLPDLRSALFGSDLHRRKFQESAHLSLMIPPPSSNTNQRTRVGGRDWPARRLFDRVISMDPPLLPITQATLELISIPEIHSLSTWFANQSKVIWKSRELSSASPFALTWNLPSTQNGNPSDDDDLTLASLLEALGDA